MVRTFRKQARWGDALAPGRGIGTREGFHFSDVQTDWVEAEVNGCGTMRVAYSKLKSSVR